MGDWLLNIVGVVFIGVLLDIILPDGKTNVFIKHIFSVFILYVILNPINNLITSNLNLKVDEIVVQENYIYETNIKKVESLQNLIVEKLSEQNISDVSVIVSANVFNESFNINAIYVDATRCKNVNTENIKQIILNNVKVKKEDIFVYEANN